MSQSARDDVDGVLARGQQFVSNISQQFVDIGYGLGGSPRASSRNDAARSHANSSAGAKSSSGSRRLHGPAFCALDTFGTLVWIPYVEDNFPTCHDPKRIFVSPKPVVASSEVKQSVIVDGPGRPLLASVCATVPEKCFVATKNVGTLKSHHSSLMGGSTAASAQMGELIQLICVGEVDHASTITSAVTVDPTGTTVAAVGMSDGSVRLLPLRARVPGASSASVDGLCMLHPHPRVLWGHRDRKTPATSGTSAHSEGPSVTAVALDTALDLVLSGTNEGDILSYLLRSGRVLRGWDLVGDGVQALAVLPVQLQFAVVSSQSRLLVLSLNASDANTHVHKGGALVAVTTLDALEGECEGSEKRTPNQTTEDSELSQHSTSHFLPTIFGTSDGRLLVVASSNSLFLVWAHSLALFRSFTPKNNLVICSFTVSEDERTVALGLIDGSIELLVFPYGMSPPVSGVAVADGGLNPHITHDVIRDGGSGGGSIIANPDGVSNKRRAAIYKNAESTESAPRTPVKSSDADTETATDATLSAAPAALL